MLLIAYLRAPEADLCPAVPCALQALANRCSAAEGTCAGMTTRVERLNRDIHQLRAITQGAEGELEKLQVGCKRGRSPPLGAAGLCLTFHMV